MHQPLIPREASSAFFIVSAKRFKLTGYARKKRISIDSASLAFASKV